MEDILQLLPLQSLPSQRPFSNGKTSLTWKELFEDLKNSSQDQNRTSTTATERKKHEINTDSISRTTFSGVSRCVRFFSFWWYKTHPHQSCIEALVSNHDVIWMKCKFFHLCSSRGRQGQVFSLFQCCLRIRPSSSEKYDRCTAIKLLVSHATAS